MVVMAKKDGDALLVYTCNRRSKQTVGERRRGKNNRHELAKVTESDGRAFLTLPYGVSQSAPGPNGSPRDVPSERYTGPLDDPLVARAGLFLVVCRCGRAYPLTGPRIMEDLKNPPPSRYIQLEPIASPDF